ncbi:MAG: hypothetical protein LLG02_05605 [Pelosinus sp.]|nr:hypothetical protein [Pelosinus sp.]
MKEEIAAKLSSINDLEDRQTLKKVLNEVFINLYEHSQAMYQKLEQRVFAEMAETSHIYDIYTTALSRQRLDPVHDFLRAMQKEDLTEKEYDMAGIAKAALSTKPYPLMKIFLNCDYRTLKQLVTKQQVFHGLIITNQGSINAAFTLRQDISYFAQVTKLYESFINNNIPWKTINNPYIFRFAEVLLQKCERLPEAEECIKEVQVDFGQYKQFVHYDIVPLWNVELLQLKGSGFPIPCQDKVNFEHTVDLTDTDGYLAVFSNETIRYVRRTRQALSIIAPTEQKDDWDIIRIIDPASRNLENHEYPLVSNAKRQEFSDIMAQKGQRAIRTEAELRRLVASFIAAENLTLSHIEIAPRQDKQDDSASYEMNFFMTDEVRRADYQNRLLLYFTARDMENFLICDQISFVVSEVQMHYPDYKCEGVLL